MYEMTDCLVKKKNSLSTCIHPAAAQRHPGRRCPRDRRSSGLRADRTCRASARRAAIRGHGPPGLSGPRSRPGPLGSCRRGSNARRGPRSDSAAAVSSSDPLREQFIVNEKKKKKISPSYIF